MQFIREAAENNSRIIDLNNTAADEIIEKVRQIQEVDVQKVEMVCNLSLNDLGN
jgi:hypothetical protein